MIWKPSPDVPQLAPPVRSSIVAPQTPDLARLKAALDHIPNSEGNELDYDHWFGIICGIHYGTDGSDQGLALAHEFSARAAKYDADFLDGRVWPYIRGERGGAVITDRTVFATAGNHGWIDPLTIDEFDVIAPEPGNPKRFEFVQAAAFSAGRPPTWIVKEVLPQAELAVIYGESGAGKSFFALDLLGSIARGIPWRGHKVQTGMRCGYIAAEGARGFRNRLRAYSIHNGIALPNLDIAVLADAPNFLQKADIVDLGHAVQAYGRLDVLVVDTLAQVTAGANENSGEDMGRVIGHCKTLHKVTGALIVLIHHSGKDASKGARGWSGIKGALDCEIEITRSDNDRCATVSKMKDGSGEGAEYGFKLQSVPVDLDEDGEVISSCVLEHGEAMPQGSRKKTIKGVMEKRVWQSLMALQTLDGVPPSVAEVIDETVNQTPFDSNSGKRDARRQNALRALNTLIDGGRLRSVDGRLQMAVDNNI